MNYQVLARKYRPQRFADVIGQQHATVTLMNALALGRIAHGYIFSGHRGIGKTTVARILAMALNCRHAIGDAKRPTAEPCGECESCTEVRAGNSVDVIEIDAATNRGIDEIRELRDAARYRPARDRYKIYILDEAHQITDAAFNALLKTLEEPPEHIVFMMATTQPEDIPQTVRSRCQHFSFRAVSFVNLVRELRSIADREEIDASDAVLNLLAETGDGSVRDALSVMDQAIASSLINNQGRPLLDVAQVGEMLGTLAGSVFERMLEAIHKGRAADLLTTANELIDAGNNPVQVARQLVRYLRNCVLSKISEGSAEAETANELLQTSLDEQRRFARSAASFSEEELTRFLQVMLRTFDEVGYRQEPRLHLELGLLKMVHLRRLLPLEELLSQLPTSEAPAAMTQGPAMALQGAGAARAEVTSRLPARPQQTSEPLAAALPQEKPVRHASAPIAETGVASSERHRSVNQTAGESMTALARPAVPEEESRPALPNLPVAAASELRQTPFYGESEPGTSPETTLTLAPEPPRAEAGIDELRAGVLEALYGAKGQQSAGDALADAEWSRAGDKVRVQTGLTKRMLSVILTPEAHGIVGRSLLRTSERPLGFEALPMLDAGGKKTLNSSPRPSRAGSAESRAHEHPIVQEAQRLFNAEIRNVIDLSNTK